MNTQSNEIFLTPDGTITNTRPANQEAPSNLKRFTATFAPINRPGSGDLSFQMPFDAETIEQARKEAESMTDSNPWKLLGIK
jgi:hypothetical protein